MPDPYPIPQGPVPPPGTPPGPWDPPSPDGRNAVVDTLAGHRPIPPNRYAPSNIFDNMTSVWPGVSSYGPSMGTPAVAMSR